MYIPISSESVTVCLNRCYIFSVFENYQRARTSFVQTVADHAQRAENIEILQNSGVMTLLRPLLLDSVPAVQQGAALAIGRLANYNNDLAEQVVKSEILPQLIYSLGEQNVSLNYHHQVVNITVKLSKMCLQRLLINASNLSR